MNQIKLYCAKSDSLVQICFPNFRVSSWMDTSSHRQSLQIALNGPRSNLDLKTENKIIYDSHLWWLLFREKGKTNWKSNSKTKRKSLRNFCSHFFVGPIQQLRHSFSQLASSRSVRSSSFRLRSGVEDMAGTKHHHFFLTFNHQMPAKSCKFVAWKTPKSKFHARKHWRFLVSTWIQISLKNKSLMSPIVFK